MDRSRDSVRIAFTPRFSWRSLSACTVHSWSPRTRAGFQHADFSSTRRLPRTNEPGTSASGAHRPGRVRVCLWSDCASVVCVCVHLVLALTATLPSDLLVGMLPLSQPQATFPPPPPPPSAPPAHAVVCSSMPPISPSACSNLPLPPRSPLSRTLSHHHDHHLMAVAGDLGAPFARSA